MTIAVYLKFPDRASAIAAARSIMAAEAVSLSAEPDTVPLMGYTDDGTRFDLDLVGGDGVYRVPAGTELRDGVEVPVFAAQPGFFANLLWHGDPDTVPDFGAARIYPATPSQTFAALPPPASPKEST